MIDDISTNEPERFDLTSLGRPRVIRDDQRQEFVRDGQVTVRDLLSTDEVNAFRAAVGKAVVATRARTPSAEEGDIYASAFSQHMNLWRTEPRVATFVLATRLASVAAQLLDVEGVRLYHDQALFKVQGAGRTPWHQDKHYWPVDTDRMITMWMPLVDLEPGMGEMVFAAGSHRRGALCNLPISEQSDAAFKRMLHDNHFEVKATGSMRAGDASFHASWTLHGAEPNSTSVAREVMTVIWMADGAFVIEPDNEGQRQDLANWLPGCRPGDAAVSVLNPLVYSRLS